MVTGQEHTDTVRDLKYCHTSKELASLGLDATVSIWDALLQPVRTIALDHADELVCMARRDDLLGVGSQNYVMLADPRDPRGVRNIPNPQRDQTVRSVSFHHDLITVGSGFGCISFFDLRAGRYLNWSGTRARGSSLELSQGWLSPSTLYGDALLSTTVPPACYSHCWDDSGTRLFACGGPLASGMVGCYLGLWE
mmetsp:Transcript_35454/g.63236  ORF Transcript_35454/g.63236 Transcript_35454/m.63236 type:complete len:195 (+) Transcript_35454:428-1012(+)